MKIDTWNLLPMWGQLGEMRGFLSGIEQRCKFYKHIRKAKVLEDVKGLIILVEKMYKTLEVIAEGEK